MILLFSWISAVFETDSIHFAGNASVEINDTAIPKFSSLNGANVTACQHYPSELEDLTRAPIESNRIGPNKVRFDPNGDKFDSTRFDSLIIALASLSIHYA
jgi:hypothetical protein